jgi:KUP system potassium uptake protein
LGIVYGDIGTSPLYALKQAVLASDPGGPVTRAGVIGAVSMILWSLIAVVSVKYAVLILRADNRGEGGIVAMLALLRAREAEPGTWRAALLIFGLVGAALLYGDGAITPAISVLSAVEGLKVDAPALGRAVLPITVAVLLALFLVQSRGTTFIGRIFGPVMIAWFAIIGLLGLLEILRSPAILRAADPFAALAFMLHAGPAISFAMLGAAFLAVTGGEAMYADMGHFGKGPIRLAWFSVVLPALILNYFGQGALLLQDPAAIENPFYQLAPDWAHYPLVAFATVATVIASQAIISGAFSLTEQSIRLGFLPRMHVKHTASTQIGQIYIPAVNWLLALGTLGAVLAFGSSDALGGAYGIAVAALMIITTVLAALVAVQWGYAVSAVLVVNGVFLLIDAIFFAANSIKLLEGGWFPLLLALVVAFIMLTWRRGQIILESLRAVMREPEGKLVTLDDPSMLRLPGTAAFLTAATTGTPLPLSQFLRFNHAVQERVLLVTVLTSEMPRVPDTHRAEIVPVTPDITRLILHFGFMEEPSIPEGVARALACNKDLQGIRPEAICYVIGHETVIPTRIPTGLSYWRKVIYAFMQRNSERSAVFFGVPANQAFELGVEIEV